MKNVLFLGGRPSEALLLSKALAQGGLTATVFCSDRMTELPSPPPDLIVVSIRRRCDFPLAFTRSIGAAAAVAMSGVPSAPPKLDLEAVKQLLTQEFVDLDRPKEPWREAGINSKRARRGHGGNIRAYKAGVARR